MKRRWGLCLVAGTIAVLVAFHRPILRGVATWLIVSDSIQNCDTLFIVSGHRRYAVAAELFAQHNVRQVVLLQEPKLPLVECQICSPEHENIRREIIKRGVPFQAILTAPGETRNLWDKADRVGQRIAAHPRERIGVIADLFHTRRLRFILERTLTGQDLSQVHIFAIRDPRFDETNWWRSRLGIKEVANAYVRQIHTMLAGRPQPFSPPDWRPEALEQRLLGGSQVAR